MCYTIHALHYENVFWMFSILNVWIQKLFSNLDITKKLGKENSALNLIVYFAPVKLQATNG